MPNPVLILNGKRIKTLDWKIEKINNLWTGHDSKSNPVREVVSTETYFCCLGKKHKVISMETKNSKTGRIFVVICCGNKDFESQ